MFFLGINRGIKREKIRITSSMRNQLTVQERNSLYMAKEKGEDRVDEREGIRELKFVYHIVVEHNNI